MKKTVLLTVFAISSVFANRLMAQAGWFKQKIDETLSIKFPKEPVKAGTMFTVQGSDSIGYVANVIDLAAMGMDAEGLAKMAPTEEFAEQFKTGLVSQSPGLELTKMEIGKWNNFVAYDIEGEQKDKGIKMYFKCIFISTKIYVLLAALPGKADVKNKDIYLSSIEAN